MFSNTLVRILIGVPLAMVVTYGLYAFMLTAITKDEINLGERSHRVLAAITPREAEEEVRTKSRELPDEINTDDKPPPPPKLQPTKSDIDLPEANIGRVPTNIDKLDRSSIMDIDMAAISDRDAQPIRPPVPIYPRRAAERGLEGTCDVRFHVSKEGEPYMIDAECTNKIFKREAERAVQKVRFAPKIIRGVTYERRNVVYPIEFNLKD